MRRMREAQSARLFYGILISSMALSLDTAPTWLPLVASEKHIAKRRGRRVLCFVLTI